MIDLDLKKKIANTLSQYELKCDKLQLQINTLKNAINQLLVNSATNYQQDEHFAQLQAQLDAEFDAGAIEKKVSRLISVIEKFEKKKGDKTRTITQLIKKSADSLNRLAFKTEDKRAVNKLQKMLDNELDNEALATQLDEALRLCTLSTLMELEELRNSIPVFNHPAEISSKVNLSLQQLLEHLSIPQDLDSKRGDIKNKLEEKLNGDNLSHVIDGLTELVIDAFNVEQNRFKGFLQKLTNQLQDFNIFLLDSAVHSTEASHQSQLLEHEIQDNIDQIKNHMDNSKTIEELSLKVNQNLMAIGSRIREFRIKEQKRDQAYQKEVDALKLKLNESEQNAEEIKNIINSQKHKINHDSLTGLPNREAYNENIAESIQRWQHNDSPLSLAVADIDHFKHINDTFGHLAGDKVLKKVAALFKSSVREGDFIARFGGEEFVFIFEHTNSETALEITEQLRKSIEECHFVYRDNKVDVTISFGLTTIKAGDTIESLFMRADKALYKAKDSGRNRNVLLD